MPATPKYNIPFPILDDAANGPAALKALAEAFEALIDADRNRLHALESRVTVRKGSVLIPTTSGQVSAANISFGGSFATEPSVMITAMTANPQAFHSSVQNVSLTGCQLRVFRTTAFPGSSTPRFYWIAAG